MRLIRREVLEVHKLPGRTIQKCIGKDGFSESSRITMGFAKYSDESGPMEPHHHAEEAVCILSAENGWVRYGPGLYKLGEKIWLEPGMILHFDELEWHVFGFEKSGHVDIVFVYGQVDHIRPEEILQK